LAEGLAAVIAQLTPGMDGWRHYFQIGNSTTDIPHSPCHFHE
jgi:hypothetical protein